MQPNDLALLRTPGSPAVSPDGRLAVVGVARLDLDADARHSSLLIVPVDGSAPARPFTHGPRDSSPAWSPDGRWIAFVRGDADGPGQLHVIPAAGGEARRLCELPLGVEGTPRWSPDSTRLAVVARVPAQGRYLRDGDPNAEAPRRVTTLRSRIDDVGWTFDRPRHVHVVEALTEPARVLQLTRGDADCYDPDWSPDSASVAFVSARHPDREELTSPRAYAEDVFVAAAEAEADARQVTDTSTTASQPVWCDGGSTIAYLGTQRLDIAGRTTGLFTVPADGSSPPVRRTDAEELDLHDAYAHGRLERTPDGGLLAASSERGAVVLVRLGLDGSVERLVDGERQALGWGVGGGSVVAAVAEGLSAGELVVAGSGRMLTELGAPLARGASLRPMEELVATADDGTQAHGWVVAPSGPGPHPVLLCVHGGPFTQYGYRLFDEAQVYAGAGYAVVLANPRGSQGYGEASGRAVVRAFGDRDVADLLALLDAALARPDLDAGRVGVMGGSYGGFMAAWLAAHHGERFRAAWCERGVYAFDSFTGSSDIGSEFSDLYITDPARPDPADLARQSPLTFVDRIRIPTLVCHSEHDLRCPLEQAQRLFVALRRQGTPTEMLLFPGESHELTRSGRPRHRVQRFEAALEWWSRHLAAPAAQG